MSMRTILIIGFVFGMCMSANLAASMYGGCEGFTMRPNNPCEVVLAAANCTFSMVLLYLAYQLISSAGGGGGGFSY